MAVVQRNSLFFCHSVLPPIFDSLPQTFQTSMPLSLLLSLSPLVNTSQYFPQLFQPFPTKERMRILPYSKDKRGNDLVYTITRCEKCADMQKLAWYSPSGSPLLRQHLASHSYVRQASLLSGRKLPSVLINFILGSPPVAAAVKYVILHTQHLYNAA